MAHTISFFLSPTTTLSLAVSLCCSVSRSLFSIPDHLSNNNITNNSSEKRFTHSEKKHQGLKQPLETPSLREPHLVATSHLETQIHHYIFEICVCVLFLVNFLAVFEDSDRLYPRRPSTVGVLALCMTPHTCCCL